MNDSYFIKKTFILAKKGKANVQPNPVVGALIVKNNIILGQGYHRNFGNLHAEVEAINNAVKKHPAKLLKGSTLYVNLEPCCHFGANPPCCDLIYSYGIKKVVFSNLDPNPKVAGKGEIALKKYGIKVVKGVLQKEGEQVNEIYFKYIKTKIPFVILKTALSLDGRITHPRNKYLSNASTLQYVHELRSNVGAILVGYNTYKKDKPRLTCRIKGGRNPRPIILPKKQINLKMLLQKLGKEKIASLLVEGGSQVITVFLKHNLADKIILLYTPEIYGSKQLAYCQNLDKIVKLRNITIEKIGDNLKLDGYVKQY